jgi:soluble lytic murein transglycosylase-like protein
MATNGFGSDFFNRVLGIAGDNLGGFIEGLPTFPTFPPAGATAGYTTSYGLAYPDDYGLSYGGGIFPQNPFEDTLQAAINYARQNSEFAQSMAAYRQATQSQGQSAQGQPAQGQKLPAMTRWARIRQEAEARARSGQAQLAIPAGGPYEEYARKVAVHYGIDPDIFVRQIALESGWNPNAVSRSGARGIAQFMPATAAAYGVNPDDPYSSLDGAARHLRDLLQRYNGDYRLALAAYNAGAGNVDRYGGVPPFEETRTYVRYIVGD